MENGKAVFGSLYIYVPNKPAPIIFAAIFAISFIGHVYQCHRYKAWGMAGIQVLCALLYVAGYALREYGAWDNYIYDKNAPNSHTVLMAFIMSQVFIYVPPPLLELSNYHVLSRMFYYVPYKTPIAPNKVFAIFGSLMSLVEIFNGLGVAFSSNPTGHEQNAGRILVIVSLSIQLTVILSFIIMTAIFWKRCSKGDIKNQAIPKLFIILYLSMSLILIRCIYRVVDHAGQTSKDFKNVQDENQDSPLERYEWFFWVFEGATMLGNSLLWNFFNPGRFLPRSTETWIGEDGLETGIPRNQKPPSAEAPVRMIMNVLTVGLWGLVFPKKTEETKYDEVNQGSTDQRNYY